MCKEALRAMSRIVSVLLLMVLQLMLLPGSVSTAGAETAPAPAPEKAARAPASPPEFRIPDGPVLSVLIRRTLLTLNDANLSGNYTVLRDLAAPGFQSANDAARLAAIFTDLRERKIDLGPIIYFDPKLVREPQIDANGMLHVSGFIPTQPEQVNFDLLFQYVSSRWRVFGIAVNTSPASPAASAVAPPPDAAAASAPTAPVKQGAKKKP